MPTLQLDFFRKPFAGHEGAETILVTNDFEDVIEIGAAKVQCIPVMKFLLSGTGILPKPGALPVDYGKSGPAFGN